MARNMFRNRLKQEHERRMKSIRNHRYYIKKHKPTKELKVEETVKTTEPQYQVALL